METGNGKMAGGEGPKKPVSQRRRLQNQQAQKNYRDRQKRQLQLLQDLTGYNHGIALETQPGAQPKSTKETIAPCLPQQHMGAENHSPESHDIGTACLDCNLLEGFQLGLDPSPTPQQYATADSSQNHFCGSNTQQVNGTINPQSLAHQEHNIISGILMHHEVMSNDRLRSDILERKTTLHDILNAGLKALSHNHFPSQSPHMPNLSDDQEKPNTRQMTLTTDKIVVLKNQPHDRAEHLPDIHRNNIRIKQVMFVAACLANKTTMGPSFECYTCADAESPFFTGSSPDYSNTMDFSDLKPYLRPTAPQITHSHHPYLDVLPFPTFRSRAITLLSTEPPMIDEDELCADLEKDGVICWGSSLGGGCEAMGSGAPWDIRSWEAQLWFLRKWWIVIGGEEGELYQQSKWWREMRGEKACYPW